MNHIFAAIDLGSNAIKLKIVQVENGHLLPLEDISVKVRLGEEVFLSNAIKLETVKEATAALNYFKQIMTDYGVNKYKAVATSALREAENSKNIIEIIRMKTGIEVEVVEDTMEKFLTYKSIRDKMDNYNDIRKGSLLVEINSGSCDVSIYNQNKLVKNDEIKLGIKSLKYILIELENRTVNYPYVLQELIETRTAHIWPSITNKKLKHFVAIGGDAKIIKEVLFNNRESISAVEFYDVYEKALSNDYELRRTIEQSGANWYEFLATFIFYKVFFKLVESESVLIPDVSLRDGILAELAESEFKLTRYRHFNNDVYTLTKDITRRYKSSDLHVRSIEHNALIFFNALKQHYKFQERDYMLLRLAATLHEVGKYTRMKDYLVTSYDIISNLDIFGVKHDEILLIAHICRFISSSEKKNYEPNIKGIDSENQIRVFKLASILSIADALDKGKKQKITIRKTEITEDAFIIYIVRSQDTVLEEWSFEFAIDNFANTFGIIPELKDVE